MKKNNNNFLLKRFNVNNNNIFFNFRRDIFKRISKISQLKRKTFKKYNNNKNIKKFKNRIKFFIKNKIVIKKIKKTNIFIIKYINKNYKKIVEYINAFKAEKK